MASQGLDPGWAWFRDYYAQYTTAEHAMKVVRAGQLISAPGVRRISKKHRILLKAAGIKKFIPGQVFVVTDILWDQVTARALKDPSLAINFNVRCLVAPGNCLYALDHFREKEMEFLETVQSPQVQQGK